MRSEKYLLQKIDKQVQHIFKQLQALYKLHQKKSSLNERIVQNIKLRGPAYNKEFSKDKKRLLAELQTQQQEIQQITTRLKSVQHLFDLLIRTEQASLYLSNQKARNDLTDIVDTEMSPIAKFSNELDQIKMLLDSFQVLRVELEKQKEYVKHFDLDPTDVDLEYYAKSEAFELRLSMEEAVSVSHILQFCNKLHRRLETHAVVITNDTAESDLAVSNIIKELKRIPLTPGLMPETIYSFLKRVSSKNATTRAYKDLLLSSICFLLSRLKANDPETYYRQIRVSAIAREILTARSFHKDQQDILIMAALLLHLDKLLARKVPAEEKKIVGSYYHTAREIFNEQFVFLPQTIKLLHATPDPGEEEWSARGARIIRAIEAYDKIRGKATDIGRYLEREDERELPAQIESAYAKLIIPRKTVYKLTENL